MKSAQEWLDEYGKSHKNPTNKKIHWICIPLIMLSLLGILAELPTPFESGYLHWGTAMVALSVIYYMTMSVPLAIGMGLIGSAMLVVLSGLAQLPVPLWVTSITIFVGAWIAQFIGHKIEGKKPSFLKDVQFLMIGPLWLLAHSYNRVGIKY